MRTAGLELLVALAFLTFDSGADAQENGGHSKSSALIERAQTAYYLGEYTKAIRAYQKAEEIHHDSNTNWNVMRCYEGEELYDEAISWIDRYIAAEDTDESDQEEAKVHKLSLRLRAYALELLAAKNYQKSLLAFREAEKRVRHRLHQYNLAQCYLGMWEYEKALTALRSFGSAKNLHKSDRLRANLLREKVRAERLAARPPLSPIPSPSTEEEPYSEGYRPNLPELRRAVRNRHSKAKRAPIVPLEGVRYRGTVVRVEGRSDIRVGDVCRATVIPADTDYNCRVKVTCRGMTIYGGGGVKSGFSKCRVRKGRRGQGPQLISEDNGATNVDGDPMLLLMFPDGPVGVRDIRGKTSFVVAISSLILERTAGSFSSKRSTYTLDGRGAGLLAKQYYSAREDQDQQYRITVLNIQLRRPDSNAAEATIEYRYRCIRRRCSGRMRGVERRVFYYQLREGRWRCVRMGPTL